MDVLLQTDDDSGRIGFAVVVCIVPNLAIAVIVQWNVERRGHNCANVPADVDEQRLAAIRVVAGRFRAHGTEINRKRRFCHG